MSTLDEVLQLAESQGTRRLDLRVSDLFGRWHHLAFPIERLTLVRIEEGFGIDGSALRGFQTDGESDLLLVPDLASAVIDPTVEPSTLTLVCNVMDPQHGLRHSHDPRHIAQKAEAYVRATPVADAALTGVEVDFYVFDDVRFQQAANTAFYFVDSAEGAWNTGRDEGPNLAYKVSEHDGYGAVPPRDSLATLRWAVVEALEAVEAWVASEHHEGGTAAQCAIALEHGGLVRMADEVQWARYLVRNLARASGRVATFMPKPMYGERGSGMRLHQSLWRGETPAFSDSNGYAGLSQAARHYIGGLLRHTPAIMAFTNATTNSYRRLVPGLEAPTRLVYGAGNRSAAVRVPASSLTSGSRRVEFRVPDAAANPYLALAAMLMAGLDGIQNRIDPGDPVERDVHGMLPGELAALPPMPRNLGEVLDALEEDHAFLLRGDVFTRDVIRTWVDMKRAEIEEVEARPTPFEYDLYFGG